MPIVFQGPARPDPLALLAPIRTQTEEPAVSDFKRADGRMFDPKTGQLAAISGDMVPADYHKTLVSADEWEQRMREGYDPRAKDARLTSNLINEPMPPGMNGMVEPDPANLPEPTPGHHLPDDQSHHLTGERRGAKRGGK